MKDVPGLVVLGVETEKWVAGSLTSIADEVPVIEAVTVSVAATVWLPAVPRVAEKVPVPFVSLELAGSTARLSLLEKWTVPEYLATPWFAASSAVTITLNAVPAVAVVGAVTARWVAGAMAGSDEPPPPHAVRRHDP